MVFAVAGGVVGDDRVGKARGDLAVRHGVVDVGRLDELLHTARAKQVAHAPRQAAHGVRAVVDSDAIIATEDALGLLVVVLVRIRILKRGKLRGVRFVCGVPRAVDQPAKVAQAVLGRGVAKRIDLLGGIVRIVGVLGAVDDGVALGDDLFEHGVFGGIVVVDRSDKGHQRVAAVKLVITHRIVAVTVREPLVIVVTAFIDGEIQHLIRELHGREARGGQQRDRIAGSNGGVAGVGLSVRLGKRSEIVCGKLLVVGAAIDCDGAACGSDLRRGGGCSSGGCRGGNGCGNGSGC